MVTVLVVGVLDRELDGDSDKEGAFGLVGRRDLAVWDGVDRTWDELDELAWLLAIRLEWRAEMRKFSIKSIVQKRQKWYVIDMRGR